MVEHVASKYEGIRRGNSYVHYDRINDMTVVTNDTGGVVTAGWGKW